MECQLPQQTDANHPESSSETVFSSKPVEKVLKRKKKPDIYQLKDSVFLNMNSKIDL